MLQYACANTQKDVVSEYPVRSVSDSYTSKRHVRQSVPVRMRLYPVGGVAYTLCQKTRMRGETRNLLSFARYLIVWRKKMGRYFCITVYRNEKVIKEKVFYSLSKAKEYAKEEMYSGNVVIFRCIDYDAIPYFPLARTVFIYA